MRINYNRELSRLRAEGQFYSANAQIEDKKNYIDMNRHHRQSITRRKNHLRSIEILFSHRLGYLRYALSKFTKTKPRKYIKNFFCSLHREGIPKQSFIM